MPKRTAREISAELKELSSRSAPERDRLTLLHEVQVYQEELIVQNEELRLAQTALEETRDRFIELYDFAPNGFVTLDGAGVVRQINLTGAAILGKARKVIEGMPLAGFLATPDRLKLLEFMRLCRAPAGPVDVVSELIVNGTDAPRDVQLICRPRRGEADGDGREFFTAMIDITERRKLEAERAQAAREHAALASRLISAQDEERQRIARDLHDNVGQQVTALRLMLQVIGMAEVDESIRARISQSQTIVEQLDRHLDFLTAELRPASLDLGIVSAIEQFAHEWSGTFDIPVEVTRSGLDSMRLRPEIETHMYRVVQEALNNVYKHAAASRVTIVLGRAGRDVELTVHDNGRGFDAEALTVHQGRGLGLASMRERAWLVGGRVDIESSPERGTTVRLCVPAPPGPVVPVA